MQKKRSKAAMAIDGGSKRTFWTDWWRKLFALIFALISFFLINGKIAQDRTIENVKVEFNVTEKNVVTVLEESVTAKIVVNTTLPIGSLKADSYRVVVNITPRREDHKYRIKVRVGPQNVRKGLLLPSAKSVTLSKESVELDPIIKKSVPIMVPITGTTRPGFTATTTLNPDTVMVEGPSEKLKNFPFVSSEELALTHDTVDFTCRLSLKNEGGDIKLIGTDSVEVVTKIVNDKELITKKYSNVPISIVNEYPQLYAVDRLSPKTGVIELRALKSIIDAFADNEVMLCINLKEAKGPGAFRARVYPRNLPPKNKAEIKYSPDYVDVVLYEVTRSRQPEGDAVKDDSKNDKDADDSKVDGQQ